MATYNVSVTQSIETQPDNVAAGGTMEYVISNPLGVDSYFTLETVPNANGAYDNSSPKNTSGSYTLGSGIRELIQNDYFASVIVSPGGGTLTLVPAVDVTGSTLRLNGVGYTDVTIVPSVVYLLDTYPNASAAYSVRKLRTVYSGSAIRVRRSSDNTEQDIGFDGNGNLDESALTTFVGANNGFVTTWYDQSGNGNNATQSTALNQCQIVSSGNVIKDNNKPALNFDGSNDFFSITAITTTNSIYSAFNVSKMNNVSANNSIFAGVAGSFQLRYQPPFVQILRQQQATLYTSAIKTTSKQYLNSIFTANTGISLYMNGVLDNSNATNPAFTQGITRIGAQASPAEFFIGPFQELIIYTSSQTSNRTGIESNINNYYAIY